MLHLGFHGGRCCGIKTISNFGQNPKSVLGARSEVEFKSPDRFGAHIKSDESFFTDEAPSETYLERFDRYIAFCKKHRPTGIIEITLADIPHDPYYSQAKWFPVVEERGFRLVNKWRNSNSSSIVRVYHLNYTNKKEVEEEFNVQPDTPNPKEGVENRGKEPRCPRSAFPSRPRREA